MKNRFICWAATILWMVAILLGCEKPYEELQYDAEWTYSDIPVRQNGIQVGLMKMRQKIILDEEGTLDPISKINFYVQDTSSPIWWDANLKLLIQVYDTVPGWSSTVIYEQLVAPSGNVYLDTITLRPGFTEPLLAQQVKVEILRCTNGNEYGGRYKGEAQGKWKTVQDSSVTIVHLFTCPINAIVNSDGWMELHFVNFPGLIGLNGQLSSSGAFNGNLYMPDDTVPIPTLFAASLLPIFELDTPIAALQNMNFMTFDYQPR